MLLASLAFQATYHFENYSDASTATPSLLFSLASDLGMAIIFLKIGEGRRWARNVLYVLAGLLLFSLVNIAHVASETNSLQLKIGMSLFACNVLAAALLIHVPSNFWKRNP